MIPVQFPAGVTNLESKNAKTVNWRESHLVRWESGVTLQPWKGWEQLATPPITTFPSRLRKMHRWLANNSVTYNAFLCEEHAFVQVNGVLQDITPVGGLIPPVTNEAGYGRGPYGKLDYGTPRPGSNTRRLFGDIYSMDNWGEDLRVMASPDGRLLGWSPSTPGTPLTPVTGAPVGNRSFVITPERHMMLFGYNSGFSRFAWSDEEDDSDWNFLDITSRAGMYDLSPTGNIYTHQLFEGGILMFASTMAHLISYVGLPYIYAYRPLGKVSTPFSPASICETPEGVIWPAVDGFWIFDGTVPKVIECTIWDWIQNRNNIPETKIHGACVHLLDHGEVLWFFAGMDPTTKISDGAGNTRYACYDYRNRVWSMGKLARSCGYAYPNDPFPIMSDGYRVWRHGTGFLYPDAPQLPWIESFNLNATGGESWLTLNKILPDVSKDHTAIKWSVVKTNERNGYITETQSPLRSKNGSGYVDIRETARDMRLRIDMVNNADWGTVGPILMDVKSRGKK